MKLFHEASSLDEDVHARAAKWLLQPCWHSFARGSKTVGMWTVGRIDSRE